MEDGRRPPRPDEDGEELEEDGPSPASVPLLPVLVVAAVLLLSLAVYGASACLGSLGGGGSTFADQISRYTPESVTYLAKGRAYLVREADGSFLALSEVEASDAERVMGCLIRYRADLNAGGENGVFRDDCHGTLFNHMGLAMQAEAPPMQRLAVSSTDKVVKVNFKQCLRGGGASPEPCRE